MKHTTTHTTHTATHHTHTQKCHEPNRASDDLQVIVQRPCEPRFEGCRANEHHVQHGRLHGETQGRWSLAYIAPHVILQQLPSLHFTTASQVQGTAVCEQSIDVLDQGRSPLGFPLSPPCHNLRLLLPEGSASQPATNPANQPT